MHLKRSLFFFFHKPVVVGGNECRRSSISCTRSSDETTAADIYAKMHFQLSQSDGWQLWCCVRWKRQTWHGYLPTKPGSHSWAVQSKRISSSSLLQRKLQLSLLIEVLVTVEISSSWIWRWMFFLERLWSWPSHLSSRVCSDFVFILNSNLLSYVRRPFERNVDFPHSNVPEIFAIIKNIFWGDAGDF